MVALPLPIKPYDSTQTPGRRHGMVVVGDSAPRNAMALGRRTKWYRSGGPGFNQNQWRELAFLTNFMLEFRKLTEDEAARIVADPWAFDEWLKSVPDWEARQFRHMLLFLCSLTNLSGYLDNATEGQSSRHSRGTDAPTVNAMDPVELDRALRETRRKLETEYGTTELDFYTPPLVHRWKQADFAEVASAITTEHVRHALAEIDREGTPASAQSTGL